MMVQSEFVKVFISDEACDKCFMKNKCLTSDHSLIYNVCDRICAKIMETL